MPKFGAASTSSPGSSPRKLRGRRPRSGGSALSRSATVTYSPSASRSTQRLPGPSRCRPASSTGPQPKVANTRFGLQHKWTRALLPSLAAGHRAVLNGSVDAKPGKRYSAEVVVAYRRDDDTIDAAAYVEQIGEFETLAADQRVDLDSLWATSDVTIEGDPIAQQAVRFAILQLIWA